MIVAVITVSGFICNTRTTFFASPFTPRVTLLQQARLRVESSLFSQLIHTQIGKEPVIHIWTVQSMETKSILKGEHTRGVCAVAFSADGKVEWHLLFLLDLNIAQQLASIGLDDNHSIVIWDWAKGLKMATARGHSAKIFVVQWHPINAQEVCLIALFLSFLDRWQLVTVGDKHIKFWAVAGGGLTSKRGTFGTIGSLDTMMCVAFAKDGTCYSGAANGLVYRY
jgi:microtubule-associated protein-like 6